MKLTLIMGVISIIFAPLVILGMIIDGLAYWFWMDVAMITYFVLVGIRLLQVNKKQK